MAARKSSRRQPARVVKPLSRTVTRIISEELERAFYRTGRRILSMYLETLAQPQAIAICQSPDRLRAAVEAAILAADSDDQTSKQLAAYKARFTSPVTRDCLALLDKTLRAQATLTGIPLDEATDLLAARLQHRITPRSLRAMLTRTETQHTLTVKNRRVMLRADILISILETRHKKQRERKGLV